ncbi:MAG: DUF2141 domain-containing protein [Chitinophagia bacterium]|nr:DUF2141 domain-containing protein [Chitinophagia bacterium]
MMLTFGARSGANGVVGVLLLLLSCGNGHNAAAQCQLHINLTHMQKKGTVYIAVYDAARNFGDPHKAIRKLVANPANGAITLTAHDLPAGDYAVAAYQDLNNNRKIDKNLIGIPTEPFAFSNNIRPVVRMPTFRQCTIPLRDKEHTITLKLMTYL